MINEKTQACLELITFSALLTLCFNKNKIALDVHVSILIQEFRLCVIFLFNNIYNLSFKVKVNRVYQPLDYRHCIYLQRLGCVAIHMQVVAYSADICQLF